eukprot:352972-Chlamydomonas_euryale.AAC.3
MQRQGVTTVLPETKPIASETACTRCRAVSTSTSRHTHCDDGVQILQQTKVLLLPCKGIQRNASGVAHSSTTFAATGCLQDAAAPLATCEELLQTRDLLFLGRANARREVKPVEPPHAHINARNARMMLRRLVSAACLHRVVCGAS